MSLHAYLESRKLADDDVQFDALIMAAMRKADNENLRLLVNAWPEIWTELSERYNAPGGVLPGDRPGGER